jgi:hypothetical protein
VHRGQGNEGVHQGCGSGLTLIRIQHFSSIWIRIRIQAKNTLQKQIFLGKNYTSTGTCTGYNTGSVKKRQDNIFSPVKVKKKFTDYDFSSFSCLWIRIRNSKIRLNPNPRILPVSKPFFRMIISFAGFFFENRRLSYIPCNL